MNRAVFLDRDGTMIAEKNYLCRPEDVEIFPATPAGLKRLAGAGFKLYIVSNQSGVGRGLISPSQMEKVQARFLEAMQRHGVTIDATYICTHIPEDGCQCRKPSPFLLQRAADEHALDLSASWMIGDREGDILCGRNAGCGTIWLRNEMFSVAHDLPTFVANGWSEIAARLTQPRGLPASRR